MKELKAHYRDFLQRCKDYGVADIEVPETSASNEVAKPLSEQAKIANLVSVILILINNNN